MLLAAVAVIAGAGLSVIVKRLVDAERDETRSYEMIGRLQEFRATSRSAVSNLRAFILTGSNQDSAAMEADLQSARAALDHYNEFLPENSDSATLLRDLGRLSSSATRVASLRHQFGAPTLAQDREVNEAIVGLESDLDQALSTRTRALETRRIQRQEEYLLTEISFAGTMLFGSLALAAAGLGLKREAAKRMLAEAQHQSIRHELTTAQALLQLHEKKDPVTGVLNREAFEEILAVEHRKSVESKAPFTLVIFELDQIRPIVQSRGREIADMVLAQAASIAKDCFRGGDVCCRYSESEFAIILPRTHLQNASIAAERARIAIESAEWPNCAVTASFGVAQANHQRDLLDLVSRAEQAVDYARRTGRNRVTAIKAHLPLAA